MNPSTVSSVVRASWPASITANPRPGILPVTASTKASAGWSRASTDSNGGCRDRRDVLTDSRKGNAAQDRTGVKTRGTSVLVRAATSRVLTSLTLPFGVGTDSHPKGTGGVREVQSGTSLVFVERSPRCHRSIEISWDKGGAAACPTLICDRTPSRPTQTAYGQVGRCD